MCEQCYTSVFVCPVRFFSRLVPSCFVCVFGGGGVTCLGWGGGGSVNVSNIKGCYNESSVS